LTRDVAVVGAGIGGLTTGYRTFTTLLACTGVWTLFGTEWSRRRHAKFRPL